MVLKKGHKPWNYGTRATAVCVTCGVEFKKMSSTATHCSRKCLWNDSEWRKKVDEGKKCPRPNSRGKKRPSTQGKNHYRWKGGSRKDNRLRHIEMSTLEYRQWRSSIFSRDNWTCQTCNKRGTYLEAHHIKSWKDFPELRYELNNGVTLCRECHNLTKIGRG